MPIPSHFDGKEIQPICIAALRTSFKDRMRPREKNEFNTPVLDKQWDQWRLLREGRLIVTAGTLRIEWNQLNGIWYLPTHSTPAITTSPFSPMKVPPTSFEWDIWMNSNNGMNITPGKGWHQELYSAGKTRNKEDQDLSRLFLCDQKTHFLLATMLAPTRDRFVVVRSNILLQKVLLPILIQRSRMILTRKSFPNSALAIAG